MVNITGLGNTYQKMMTNLEVQTLKSLILLSPLERKRSCHFSTFIRNVHQLDTQMGLRLVRVDALRRES